MNKLCIYRDSRSPSKGAHHIAPPCFYGSREQTNQCLPCSSIKQSTNLVHIDQQTNIRCSLISSSTMFFYNTLIHSLYFNLSLSLFHTHTHTRAHTHKHTLHTTQLSVVKWDTENVTHLSRCVYLLKDPCASYV